MLPAALCSGGGSTGSTAAANSCDSRLCRPHRAPPPLHINADLVKAQATLSVTCNACIQRWCCSVGVGKLFKPASYVGCCETGLKPVTPAQALRNIYSVCLSGPQLSCGESSSLPTRKRAGPSPQPEEGDSRLFEGRRGPVHPKPPQSDPRESQGFVAGNTQKNITEKGGECLVDSLVLSLTA